MDMKDLFVTYSWDSQLHNDRVIAFVNHLRNQGFAAEMDRMLMQQESAIDFSKMMHRIMTDYRKVIVVLSEGYKQKAEQFTGGVGNEYAMIIKDISQKPNKYILVCFEGISNEIFPLALQNRETIDLSNTQNELILFHKLLDQPAIEFTPIAPVKPTLNSIKTEAFSQTVESIKIERLINRPTNSMSAAGIYEYAVNEFQISIKNISSKPLDSFSLEVALPYSLRPSRRLQNNEFGFIDNGSYLIKNFSVNQKLFPNQIFISDVFLIEVNRSNYFQAKEAEIIVTAYSDSGTTTLSFQLADYFKSSSNYGQPENLNSMNFG